MSMKLFNGLGVVDTSSQASGDAKILQGSGPKSQLPPKNTDTLHTTIQQPRENSPAPRPVQDTGIKPKVMSQESAEAPFETLFDEMEIRSTPHYNFWTPDELNNDRDGLGNRKFDDLPRYIKLEWSVAPDLKDPDIVKFAKDVTVRDIRPIIFSREGERKNVFQSNGMGFTPSHLQVEGFSKIKGMIADGFLAPGVVQAVVEINLRNAGIKSPEDVMTGKVNEDAFLTDPGFAGISIHEFIGQINQVSDGIASMGNASEGVNPGAMAQKGELVDGKFTVSNANGKMSVSSVHPSSPSLGFSATTAVAAKPIKNDEVSGMAKELIREESDSRDSLQVKVKFANPAISGLVSQKKVNLMTAPEHVESLAAIAPALPDLEIISRTNMYEKKRRTDIPSLQSPRMKPLEYIGYVIEKYRKNASGAFVKIDEIDIPNRTVDSYIDTKVTYGTVYRYRIKSILRWTRKSNIGVNGPEPTVTVKYGSQTEKIAPYSSSYFSSEWCRKWAYAACVDTQPPVPPDELTVRPESHKKRIVVTFRLPENPQKDIWKMRLYRKFKDELGRDATDWMPVVDSESDDSTLSFSPQNVIYFDNDVEFFQKGKTRIVYAAQCISRHGEQSTLSEQLCARLNESYFTKGEYPVEFVSSAGVRREYYGAFSTNPVQMTKTEIVLVPPATAMGKSPGISTVSLHGRDANGSGVLDAAKYICRIQSLDTGEQVDVPFNVTFTNLPEKQEVAEYDFYVPTSKVPPKNESKDQSRTHGTPPKKNKKESDEKKEVSVKDRSMRGERW